MADSLKAVLENCWLDSSTPDTLHPQQTCRWCHHGKPLEHDPSCPCVALSRSLEQRDAIASYVKAEKRYMTMQGAARLARQPAKEEMKQRLNEALLQLEAALSRLHELGIEEMVR